MTWGNPFEVSPEMEQYHADRKSACVAEIKMRMPELPEDRRNELTEICLSMAASSDLRMNGFDRMTAIAEFYEQKCGGSSLWLLKVIPLAIAEINKVSHPHYTGAK